MNDIYPDKFYIEWLDSAMPRGWARLDEMDEPAPHECQTIGFMVSESESAVRIASSLILEEGQEQASGIIEIPRRAIKKIRRVEVKLEPVDWICTKCNKAEEMDITTGANSRELKA